MEFRKSCWPVKIRILCSQQQGLQHGKNQLALSPLTPQSYCYQPHCPFHHQIVPVLVSSLIFHFFPSQILLLHSLYFEVAAHPLCPRPRHSPMLVYILSSSVLVFTIIFIHVLQQHLDQNPLVLGAVQTQQRFTHPPSSLFSPVMSNVLTISSVTYACLWLQ